MTRTIPASDLPERLTDADADAGPLLLDVRTAAEFETSRIPASVNVPLDALTARTGDVVRALDGRQVVLICRSGKRAAQAQQALAAAGLPAEVLTGGVLDWEATGGALDRGRQVWELERQVRFTAGGLVLIGILGSLAVPRLKWLSGAIGAGLVFAAVSNTCAMGMAMARMPWNRGGTNDTDPIDALLQDR